MPEKLQDNIHITLIGQDTVLAAILAEQATGKADGKSAFDFTSVDDITKADPLSDVWLLNQTTVLPNVPLPLCIVMDVHDINLAAAQPSDVMHFSKPFRLAELLEVALSGAALRRMKNPRVLGKDTHGSDFIFKPFARVIENADASRSVLLTEKEARFLCAVLDAGDIGLKRSDAMTQIWGYHPDVESHAVDTTLYRLRQKLDDLGIKTADLRNENGAYRWSVGE